MFEDTNGRIGSCKWKKETQYNGQAEKIKRKNKTKTHIWEKTTEMFVGKHSQDFKGTYKRRYV
jgi:hypothetical protein